MSGAFFIDSAGFFASLDATENNHQRARFFMSELEQKRHSAFTTDHVVSETYTLLKARSRGHLVRNFYEGLKNSRSVKIVWTDKHRFEAATAMLLRQTDKNYSFVDCLSFVVMKENKLTDALTTDEHFNQAGFKPLLAG